MWNSFVEYQFNRASTHSDFNFFYFLPFCSSSSERSYKGDSKLLNHVRAVVTNDDNIDVEDENMLPLRVFNGTNMALRLDGWASTTRKKRIVKTSESGIVSVACSSSFLRVLPSKSFPNFWRIVPFLCKIKWNRWGFFSQWFFSHQPVQTRIYISLSYKWNTKISQCDRILDREFVKEFDQRRNKTIHPLSIRIFIHHHLDLSWQFI